MKKILSLVLALCLLAGIGSAFAEQKAYKIALITMDSIDQHWVTLNEGAQAKAISKDSTGFKPELIKVALIIALIPTTEPILRSMLPVISM